MKSTTLILAIASCSLIAAGRADAAPIAGRFVNDARGDAPADQTFSREIGDVALFPVADALVYHDHRYHLTVGVPDDLIANDWLVHITNVSGQAWANLFFVADSGATIGNADGKVEDQIGAPGVYCDAFRIDATGTNANLIHESMNADGILEPGEDWEFAVSNFGTGFNSYAPSLITPGLFAGSSTVGGPGQTNASILAVPVPEPTLIGALVLPVAAMLMRRPGRARSH